MTTHHRFDGLDLYVPKECTIKTYPNAQYDDVYQAMLATTLEKIAKKAQGRAIDDEIWLVEHQDVYTLGQAGKNEHILGQTKTPVIKTDRGGQVTWHGKGQLVVYFLFDLQRLGFGVRDLVSHAEQTIEDVLNDHLPSPFTARARRDAPGVYVFDGEMLIGKIASLGFKIKQAHSYHGIAINLDNDLSAFDHINPCGYAGMKMLRLADFCAVDWSDIITRLLTNIDARRQGKTVLR